MSCVEVAGHFGGVKAKINQSSETLLAIVYLVSDIVQSQHRLILRRRKAMMSDPLARRMPTLAALAALTALAFVETAPAYAQNASVVAPRLYKGPPIRSPAWSNTCHKERICSVRPMGGSSPILSMKQDAAGCFKPCS